MKKYKIWMHQSNPMSEYRAGYIDLMFRKLSEMAGVTYVNSSIEKKYDTYMGKTLFRRRDIERKMLEKFEYYAIVKTDDYDKLILLKKLSICKNITQWNMNDLLKFEPLKWEKHYSGFITEIEE